MVGWPPGTDPFCVLRWPSRTDACGILLWRTVDTDALGMLGWLKAVEEFSRLNIGEMPSDIEHCG